MGQSSAVPFRVNEPRVGLHIVTTVLPVLLVTFMGFLSAQTALAVGGSVYAWGYNNYGVCNVPGGLTDVVAVRCGDDFSMALRANGTVATWGDTSWRQVPAEATNLMAISFKGSGCLGLRHDGTVVCWDGTPASPSGTTGIVAIAAGGGHYLALREDGELLAWGANNYGQCNIPLEAIDVVAIDAGYTHSLALRKDGSLLAWGENLGGTTNIPPEATNIIAISCGPDFNLALRADRRVIAWGLDWGGNLPVPESATNVVAVSAGEMPDFAIRADGSVVAWGRNDNGELNVPSGLQPAFAIGAGNFHSLGIRVVGGVSLLRQPTDRIVGAGDSILFNIPAVGRTPLSYQWRFNGTPMSGETSPVLLLPRIQSTNAGNYDVVVQNGSGAVTSQVASVTILPAAPTITLNPTARLATYGDTAQFMVRAKGSEPLHYQWQFNGVSLSDETNTTLSVTGVRFESAGNYRVIVTNELGTATSEEGRLEVTPVFAWGENPSGVLNLPFGLTNVVSLAGGEKHCLALKSDGTVIAWGDDTYNPAGPLLDGSNWVAIAAANGFSVGLRSDGSAVAFSDVKATNVIAIAASQNYSLMLKDDGGPPLVNGWYYPPTPPASATNLISIAAGSTHSLGIRRDGSVVAWGDNYYGQTNTPASVSNVLAVAAGVGYSLALRDDGTVVGWGNNVWGQLNIPPEATNIVSIAAGPGHVLAIREEGRVFVWGNTNSGRGIIPSALSYAAAVAAGYSYNLAVMGTGNLRFTRQPRSQNVSAGDRTAFNVSAAGAGPMTYQWMCNGTNVPGANHAWFIIPDTQAADAVGYAVVISNGFGSITSIVATLTVSPSAPVVVNPPASQLAVLGGSAAFAVLAKGTEPIAYQWRFNGSDLPGATASPLTITNVQWTNTGAYDVVVSNSLGAATSTTATLTFQPTVDSFDLGGNNAVYALAPQPDGKVLLGGTFTTLGGQPRTSLARLNLDGTLDATFNPLVAGAASWIFSLAVQPDGRILVGGAFTSVCGQARTNLARLNPDGTLDLSFNVPVAGLSVKCLALQPDGKVMLGGEFTSVLGQPRSNLARLNPDGTLDNAFAPSFNTGAYLFALALQSDGKILLGGGFTTLNGQARTNIGRLNADGSLDTAFNPGTPGNPFSLVMQPDGRILVGGGFTALGGQTRNQIGRLNADGTLDAVFNPGANGRVFALALQADGKVLAAGEFTSLGGQGRSHIGRLNPDGTLDATFNPGANSDIFALAVQPDSRILAGGYFTNFGGQARSRIARVSNTAPATQTLTLGDTNITWLRGGASPEIWRATFEASTNGTDWLSLGDGAYGAGNWQLNGIAAPPNATIRARGYASAGYENGSAWFVEDGTGPPAFSLQPASQSNVFGTTATFSALAVGTPPITYQWRKDGTNLTDGGQVFGAFAPTLRLFSVSGANRGGYSVMISNSSGSVTSVVATLAVTDPFITVQPVSQVVTSGQTATFTVTATGTTPLNFQWGKYGTNLAGATASSLTLTNVQWADVGDYHVLVSNGYGTNASTAAALAFAAGLDTFNPTASGTVYALAVQTDGKILVGGDFASVGGQTRYNVGRLLPNGGLDTAFNPYAGDSVYTLAMQTDGRILLGGIFPTMGGQTRSRLARINPDGSLDANFNPGANTNVNALVVQPDGRILVGGAFTNLGGQARTYLGRLNADGSLDMDFNPAVSRIVYSLAIQPDGKILVGGAFTNLCGQARSYLGRLNSDGTLDSAFNSPASTNVYCLLVQPDGKILVGGAFTSLGGQSRTYLGRLNANGTLDNTFNPVASSTVYSLALQADGRILVGGNFTTLGGQTRRYIGRLNPDGTVDATFNPSAGNVVYALALQADGSIIAGGSFTTFASQSRSRLARISNTYPAIQSLAFDGSNMTWLRNGASPELWRTAFEFSTNGSSWASLGDGTRIPGGWQLPAAGVSPNATIFARGFVAAGYQGGSSWYVETGAGPPAIRAQPVSRTNNAATAATFNVVAVGGLPLDCQWFKDGASLTNGGNVSGAQSFSLTVSNVLGADSGQYRVVITNASGSVTSLVATLNVVDPYLSKQPTSRTNNAGTTATFTIQAAGTALLNLQWFKDGAGLEDNGNISGTHTATLTLSNVFGGDRGGYWITVSNALGVVTSAVANLGVNDPWLSGQPTSQSVQPGQPAVFSVAAVGTAPVYQWRKDGVPVPGATATTLNVTNAQRSDAGLYDVVVSNVFGTATSTGAMLTVNLATTDSLDPGANGAVYSLAVQSDAKILVGGEFVTLGTQPRSLLGRLNPDGTIDAEFAPNASGNYDAYCSCFAVQPDGKILVGGYFLTLAGHSQADYGRLFSNGTLDSTFGLFSDGWVTCLLPQADGRILMGGAFTTLGGQIRNCIARFDASGALDPSFNPGANGAVLLMAIQPDGRILACGAFTTLAGQPRSYLGRLNADGTIDADFSATANAPVYSLALQPDGKVIVGGSFTNLNGQSRKYIGRLNGDGTLDTSFNPGANDFVNTLAIQTDGTIVAGGRFTMLAGRARSRLGRLSADGRLDNTFDPRADYTVNTVAVQADGKIIVGGSFTNLGSQMRARIGRLANPDPANQTLSFDGSRISWLRSGSSPELWRTSFDVSADGTNWVSLGAGTRISGGWQVTNVSVPLDATLRARGFVQGGGYYNGSSWFVENQVQLRPEVLAASFTSNQFGASIRAMPGLAVVIEASTNLMQWTAILTNVVPGGGIVFFTDPDSGQLPRRFYRVRYYLGTLPPPRILTGDGKFGFHTNVFGFNLSGVAGQTVVVEASSNLVNWAALATNTLGTDLFYFSDVAGTNFALRFYRARVP